MVTAQKREQSLQEVPISITVLTSAMMERSLVNHLADLQGKVPNVNITDGAVVPSAFIPTIRGVGDRSADQLTDQPVLVVVDGVAYNGMQGALMDTFDLAAVEILRGPQGTLQGRNATGGVVNIRSKLPSMTEKQLRAQFEYGSFSTWTARLAIDGPIVEDKFAAKLALVSTDSRGSMDNTNTGGHSGGKKYTMARLAGLFTPNDDVDIHLTASYVNDESDQPMARQINDGVAYPRPETGGQGVSLICALFGLCTPAPRGENSPGYTEPNSNKQIMLTAIIDWDVGPVTFTSVSGYRDVEDIVHLDLDFTELEFLDVRGQLTNNKTWSQELRMASSDGGGWDMDGRLQWVVGLYYLGNEWDTTSPVCLVLLGVPCGTPPGTLGQKLDSYAAFTHANYSITDQLEVFGGIRYTKDEKKYHQEVPVVVMAQDSWSQTSWGLGVRYNFADNHMAYLRYDEGYRSGGFNPTGIAYNPETVGAVELGLKMQSSDHRLQLNADVFQYDYKDMQRGVVFPSDLIPFYIQGVANAAGATIWGSEFELTALATDNLLLGLQIGYLDASYDEYIDFFINPDGTLTQADNSGLRLPNTPHWTPSASIDYTVDTGVEGLLNEILFHVDYGYKSKYNAHPNDLPLGEQAAFGLLTASVQFTSPSGKYSFTVYGKNLTDEYYVTLSDAVGGLTHYFVEGVGRFIGVRLTADFDL